MKFITTLLLVTLLFSTQLFSQDKGGVLPNTGNSRLDKFNEILKQTIVDNEEDRNELFINDNKFKDPIREFFITLKNNSLNSGSNNSLEQSNSLSKTVVEKRFLRTEETYQNWDGAAWTNSSKYTYSYDTRDNTVQQTSQTWNGTTWVNSNRYSSLYDANDNETESISQSWNGTTWVNSYKYTSAYDANNNRVEEVGQNWSGSVWTNSSRYLTTYNSNNKRTLERYQSWNGTTWVDNSRYVYTYDANRNTIQYDYQTWSGTAWVNYYRYTSAFNANNKRTEQISSNWNGTTWVNSNRSSITYDANNNPTEYLYQTWDVSVWKNNSRSSYSYNTNDDITQLTSQSWDGAVWVNNDKYILTYDARYNMTEILGQTWDVAVWKNSYKYSYVFDANDNNTQQIYQTWDGSVWVNQNKSLQTYVAGHYQTTISLNTNYTFEDPTKTTSYQIIGLPGANNLPIANILSGTPGATGDWRAFWDPGTGAYTEYTSSGSTFNFTPGKAFWLISKNAININQSVNAVPMTNDNTYSIPLHSEWNLISNPFNKTISWNSIQNLNSTVQPIHFFQGGSYTNPANFEPYKGYYFFNNTGLTNMIIPYSGSAVLPKQTDAPVNELEIILTDGAVQKASINIGVSEQAQEGMDMMDIFSPPSQYSEVSISLINNKLETNYKLLQKDYRPLSGEGLEFDFSVKNISDRNIEMMVNGLDNFTEQEVYLLDKSSFQMYDIKIINSFELRNNITNKKYSLLIGTTDFINQKENGLIPTEFNLFQNYPNPFNPSTLIMFALPKQSNVSLKIYNILGELVSELINNQTFEAGYHEIEFNGSQLASGIYLYKMETISSGSKQFVETKKMLMIK